MALTNEIRYFQRREDEERQAAQTASSARLKEIFDVLADRYADRVWSLMEQQYDLVSGDESSCDHTIMFEDEDVERSFIGAKKCDSVSTTGFGRVSKAMNQSVAIAETVPKRDTPIANTTSYARRATARRRRH